MLRKDIQEFVKKLEFTGGKYSASDIFRDIITLSAYFINATMLDNKEYAKEFDKLMAKYTITEQKQMWQIMYDLIELYQKQREANDIMTEVFAELGLENKNTGQFFTPASVSNCMAEIVVGSKALDEEIKKYGYTTFHEPTCRCRWYDFSICKNGNGFRI